MSFRPRNPTPAKAFFGSRDSSQDSVSHCDSPLLEANTMGHLSRRYLSINRNSLYGSRSRPRNPTPHRASSLGSLQCDLSRENSRPRNPTPLTSTHAASVLRKRRISSSGVRTNTTPDVTTGSPCYTSRWCIPAGSPVGTPKRISPKFGVSSPNLIHANMMNRYP